MLFLGLDQALMLRSQNAMPSYKKHHKTFKNMDLYSAVFSDYLKKEAIFGQNDLAN